MLSKWFGKSVVIGFAAFALSSYRRGAEPERQQQEAKQQAFVTKVDFAHIYVTPDDPPSNKPFIVLGDVTYTEPFTPDAINEAKIKEKLKNMGYAKWPDTANSLFILGENRRLRRRLYGEGFGGGSAVRIVHRPRHAA